MSDSVPPTDNILSLPSEPPVGHIIELLDGNSAGTRYKRDDGKGWRRLGWADSDRWYSWSEIWCVVTEDGAGGEARSQ